MVMMMLMMELSAPLYQLQEQSRFDHQSDTSFSLARSTRVGFGRSLIGQAMALGPQRAPATCHQA